MSNYQEEFKNSTTLSEQDLINLVNELSVEHFGNPVTHSISFNKRLKTTAGRVMHKYLEDKLTRTKTITLLRIEFNPAYLKEYGMEEFIGTIKHELVHYHCLINGKGHKHGDKDFISECKRINAPLGGCAKSMKHKNNWKYLYECIKCKIPMYRHKILDLRRIKCKCGAYVVLMENRTQNKEIQVVVEGIAIYHDPKVEGPIPKPVSKVLDNNNTEIDPRILEIALAANIVKSIVNIQIKDDANSVKSTSNSIESTLKR